MKGRDTASSAPSLGAPRKRETRSISILGQLADHLGALALLGLGVAAAVATFNAMA